MHLKVAFFEVLFLLFRQDLVRAFNLNAESEKLSCGFKVGKRRIRGCDTDVTVLRVYSVRIGRACARHYYACFFSARNDRLCASGKRIEGDEISALRLRPLTDAETAELVFKYLEYLFELRTENVCVAAHMLVHSIDILEETDVAKLIHLIVSYRLYTELTAIAAIPEPGKDIFEVDANLYTISGLPALRHSSRISSR